MISSARGSPPMVLPYAEMMVHELHNHTEMAHFGGQHAGGERAIERASDHPNLLMDRDVSPRSAQTSSLQVGTHSYSS